MSKETSDTLGNQKKINYALQDMTKEAFIKEVLTGLTPPPAYFPQNVMMNIQGYDSIDEGCRFKVKRIQVRPGASLSLQKHRHRAERRTLRGLEHDGTTRRERRRHLAGNHGDRVVPGRDGANDTHRFAPNEKSLIGAR